MLTSEAGTQRTEGSVTIAVLTDLHYGPPGEMAQRRSEIADTLLQQAVYRLNHLICPDVTVVLGDLLDDGTAADAHRRLACLSGILDKLASPRIVIPGNHDGDVASFYRVFDRPAETIDLCGVRFLPFIDRDAPGHNATRSEADIARFVAARCDYAGPVVALQHVSLAPPGYAALPYNYTNAAEIVTAMRQAEVALSLSGHYHTGTNPIRDAMITFINAPSLCEAPFPFLSVTLAKEEGSAIRVVRHTLADWRRSGL
jgi:hypothetical protein